MTTERIGKAKLIRVAERRALPTAEYMEITPDLATEWLSKSGRNRQISELQVERYAEMMARGDWLTTDQGIAFDENGDLINGQHRLNAIVKANRTVTMLVTRDLPNRSQLVMDQGLKRQAHEQISIREGWEVQAIHVAVAKVMIMGIGGPGHLVRRRAKGDIQLLDRFYVHHHEAIEYTVHHFHKNPSIRGVTIAPVMGPVARAYYSEPHEELVRFAEVVTTGMAVHRNDGPAVVLRNWLIAGRERLVSARKSGDRDNVYKKSEIALRAFLDGRPIERLGQMNLNTELWPIPGEEVAKEAVRAK